MIRVNFRPVFLLNHYSVPTWVISEIFIPIGTAHHISHRVVNAIDPLLQFCVQHRLSLIKQLLLPAGCPVLMSPPQTLQCCCNLCHARSPTSSQQEKLFDQTLHNTTLFTPHGFCNRLFHCLRGTSGKNPWSIFQGTEQAHTDNSSKAEEESELGMHHSLPNSLHSEPDFSPSARACGTAVVALGARGTTEGWGKSKFTFQDSHSKFSCGAVSKL